MVWLGSSVRRNRRSAGRRRGDRSAPAAAGRMTPKTRRKRRWAARRHRTARWRRESHRRARRHSECGVAMSEQIFFACRDYGRVPAGVAGVRIVGKVNPRNAGPSGGQPSIVRQGKDDNGVVLQRGQPAANVGGPAHGRRQPRPSTNLAPAWPVPPPRASFTPLPVPGDTNGRRTAAAGPCIWKAWIVTSVRAWPRIESHPRCVGIHEYEVMHLPRPSGFPTHLD